MPKCVDLEIFLLGIKPKIWRRFLITPEAMFMNLHYAIQRACGWEDAHLYEFLGGRGKHGKLTPPFTMGQKPIAGASYPDPYEDKKIPFADDVEIGEYFPKKGKRCFYVYNFGDPWEHLVELKQRVEVPEDFVRRLTDGARAFPPEDCGSIPGYERCLKAVQLSEKKICRLDAYRRQEVEDTKEWVGNWDPEDFDLDAINKKSDL